MKSMTLLIRILMSRGSIQGLGLLFFVLLFHLNLPSALALKDDKDQPIEISAHRVDLNQKTGLVVYQGRVRFKQGSLRILADRIEVQTQNNTVETFYAYGHPVHLRQQSDRDKTESVASAERVVYRRAEDTLDFFGAVAISQGRNKFNAGHLHYDRKTDRFYAKGNPEGGKRVRAVYYPNSSSPASATAP